MTKTTIFNVDVFDGQNLVGPTTVVIDGSVIGVANSPGPAGAEIDGTGCTLLPGLIDCHVHAYTEDHLREFASYGVTTVLDMGSFTDIGPLRTRSNRPGSGLPSYRSALCPAAHPSSRHAAFLKLADADLVGGAAEAEPFAAARLAAGPDYLKIIGDVPGFDEPTLAALAKAARDRGMLSIAHAAHKQAYERAVRAGVDVLTHIPVDGVLDDETVAQLKAADRVVVPTLGMMNAHVAAMKRIPGKEGLSFDTVLANLEKLHQAGVPLCAGTDANDIPTLAYPMGISLHDELELMTRGGMTTTEVLRAATSEAAKAFGFGDRGSVREGLRADLALVEGNPVEDIAATKNLRRVWIGGVEVPLSS